MSAIAQLNAVIAAHSRGRIDYGRLRDDFGLVLVTGELSASQLLGVATCARENGVLDALAYADLSARLVRVMKREEAEYVGDEPTEPGLVLDSRPFCPPAPRLAGTQGI